MFPLYIVGGPVPAYTDTARYTDYWTRINGLVLTRVLLDILLRHVIRQARQEYELVGAVVFAAGLALSTVTLVAASLEGGAALDTLQGAADATAIRTLNEGTILIYQSIGGILLALFAAAAGYAILGTGVLPSWTCWLAYVAAGLNVVAVSIGLSIAPAAVLAVAIIADFPLQIWLLIVGILLIRTHKSAIAPTLPTVTTNSAAEPLAQSTVTR